MEHATNSSKGQSLEHLLTRETSTEMGETEYNNVSSPTSGKGTVTSDLINRARTNPKALSPANVIALQRTIGNKAVQRLITRQRQSHTNDNSRVSQIQRSITIGTIRYTVLSELKEWLATNSVVLTGKDIDTTLQAMIESTEDTYTYKNDSEASSKFLEDYYAFKEKIAKTATASSTSTNDKDEQKIGTTPFVTYRND